VHSFLLVPNAATMAARVKRRLRDNPAVLLIELCWRHALDPSSLSIRELFANSVEPQTTPISHVIYRLRRKRQFHDYRLKFFGE
jgi:hypothetical protein